METDKANTRNMDPGPTPKLVNNTVEAASGERTPDPNPPEERSQTPPLSRPSLVNRGSRISTSMQQKLTSPP